MPRAFWFLFVGTLVNRIGAFVVPFLALYLTNERHVGIADAGMIMAVFGIGAFAAGPVGGALADRVGRRFTIGLATTLGAVAMLILGLARSPTELTVGALVLGFFGEMYRPAANAMIADLVPAPDRVRAYGLVYWAANVGFSIASVLAGLLAGKSFTLLFVADAATTALFGAFVVATVKETRAPSPPAAAKSSAQPSLWAPYRDGGFLLFCGLTALVALVYGQVQVALPIDMRAHGISPRTYGMLLAINGVLVVVGQPFALALVTHLPRYAALAAATLVVAIGFGMTGLAAGSVALYAASIGIWSAGEIAMAPIKPSVIADLAPAELRGSYQGAFQMAYGSASFLGPALGSLVLGSYGSTALWRACAIAGCIAALGFAGIHVSRRRARESRASRAAQV